MTDYTGPEESYEPEASVVEETQAREATQNLVETIARDVQLRLEIANIASRIPWNPTEPVTDEGIKQRMNLVLDFVLDRTSE